MDDLDLRTGDRQRYDRIRDTHAQQEVPDTNPPSLDYGEGRMMSDLIRELNIAAAEMEEEAED